MLEVIENQLARSEQSKKRLAESKKLADGHDPHMVDVSRHSGKSWLVVASDEIARC